MKNLIRVLSLCLSVLLLMGLLAACGAEPSDATAGTTQTTAAPTEPKRELTIVGDAMRHMSYNMAGSTGTDRIPNFATKPAKQAHFKALIEELQPDTFGIQEAPLAWREGLVGLLDNQYGLAGATHPSIEGNEKIWINAIYYKVDTFTCLEDGILFLSEDFSISGSSNRSLSYAYLERIADGERILVMSTHLSSAVLGGEELRKNNFEKYGEDTADYNSSRDKQVKLISKAISVKLEEFAATYDKEISVIVCGDFNVNAWTDNKYSHEYTRLRETMAATTMSPGIEDSAVSCVNLVPNQSRKQWQTYRSTGEIDPYHRLDYIFMSANLPVDSHTVYLTEEKIADSSDHYPIYTDYYIGH